LERDSIRACIPPRNGVRLMLHSHGFTIAPKSISQGRIVNAAVTVPLLVLLCIGTAMAQQSPRFTVTHYSYHDGLGSNNVRCLLQDSFGILWAGTGKGLSRYDGYRWQTYRFRNSQALKESNNICCLLEDERTNLWVGFYLNGLHSFDRKTLVLRSFLGEFPAALPARNVWSIARDSSGTTWFATDAGLFYLARNATTFSRLNSPVKIVLAMKLICDRDGSVWVLGRDALWRIGTQTHQVFTIPLPPDARTFITPATTMEMDSGEGIILNQTNHARPAVARVRRNGAVSVDHLPTQSARISAEHQDHLLVTPDHQSWRIRQRVTTTPAFVQVEQSTADITVDIGSDWMVYCIIPDRMSGIWWMATSNGAYKIVSSNRAIFAYRAKELGENSVWSVGEIGGRLLLGTTRGLMEMRSNGQIHPVPYSYHGCDDLRKTKDLYFNALCKISEDSMLIVSQAGLYLFHPQSSLLTDFGPNADFTGKRIKYCNRVTRDGDGRYWIGTTRDGVYRFSDTGRVPAHFQGVKSDSSSLPSNFICSMASDRNNRIWVGTNKGLALWNEKQKRFKRYTATGSSEAICGSYVASIALTPNGTMWVGCPNVGISMYRETTDDFVSFTQSGGFPFSEVCTIVPQGNDTLWINTDDAVYRFVPSTGSVLALHGEDGLHGDGDEFTLNSGYRADDGRLFFGGYTGLTVIVSPALIVRGSEPKIILTSVMSGDSALGRDIVGDTHFETTHNHNTLLFTFGLLDNLSVENNRIEYMLEGIDTHWMRDAGRGQVAYAALAPGTYRLRLRGTNSQGVRSRGELVATIDVLPIWWQTWQFQLLAGCALITIAAGIFHQRRRRHVAFHRAVEKVRSRERRLLSSDIHDGPLQDLFGLRFVLEGPPGTPTEALTTAASVTRKVREDLSGICAELRPAALERGLGPALQHLIELHRGKHPAIRFETFFHVDERRIGEEQREAIYFVARTGIANVIKHAQASRVRLQLRNSSYGTSLEIQDDGIGFVVAEPKTGHRDDHQFGLDLCREFSRACDGIFSVDSTPGMGTTLQLDVRKRAWWETISDRISRRT
jgi:ligand-binding sensor domain-containing protein/signal transduction histidine kinase